MKRFTGLLAICAATIAVATPMAASAAPGQNNGRQAAQLENRINQGVRNGALSRNEATRLRNDVRTVSRLETQYRRSGNVYTARERNEIDRRYNVIASKIRIEKQRPSHGSQHRR